MQRITFKSTVKAKPQKVWQILWGEDSYTQWTAPFCEGSRAVSDWQEGSRILFLNNEGEGMISRIAEKKENAFMSFEHIGMIDKEGKEDLDSELVKNWAGAKENYTLTAKEEHTELLVEMDTAASHLDYFKEAWPKALKALKTLAENQS